MQLNYHFLKRLVPALKEQLEGAVLATCFSQERDELILGFSRYQKSDFYIRATLTSSFSCLSFPEDFKRSRKNSVNLFNRLIDQEVLQIKLFENERAFLMEFLDHDLVFKLHGNRSNLVAYLKDGQREFFKNQLKGDLAKERVVEDRPIERSLDLYQQNPNFKDFYPTFGPIPLAYLRSKGFDELSIEAQWAMLEAVNERMETNPFYLIDFQGKPAFSLLAMGDARNLGHSPIEASNQFFRHFTSNYYLALEKQQAASELARKLKQTQSYIRKSESRLEKLQQEIQPEQIADILMANLHAIPPRVKKVSLFNFYDNSEIEIKLNAELSPQKNAEQYYRKSKNRKIEVEKTEANVFSKYEILERLNRLKAELDSINDLRELRKWLNENQLAKSTTSAKTENTPYKAFDIAGYAIWVGKNAKANDELTLKYAYKEDLWLHAKDVPGSHLLIKHKAGGNTPKNVIEKAAGLAAWYSKRKTDSLVPVIVTPAKFVRKRKGSPAGQVVVAKEEVVMVPPLKPEDL